MACVHCGTTLYELDDGWIRYESEDRSRPHTDARCRDIIKLALATALELVDDRQRALRVAYELTLDCQSAEEACTELVRIARMYRDMSVVTD
jgi:hypothetical protein